jgi:hypothetical protein
VDYPLHGRGRGFESLIAHQQETALYLRKRVEGLLVSHRPITWLAGFARQGAGERSIWGQAKTPLPDETRAASNLSFLFYLALATTIC